MLFVFIKIKNSYYFYILIDYRNNSHQNGPQYQNNWHLNQGPQNQYNRSNSNGSYNNSDRYNRPQNTNSYRSDNNAYPNYGTRHTAGQQSNDRPGYFTDGYLANNSQ